jgi:hypothetical protein
MRLRASRLAHPLLPESFADRTRASVAHSTRLRVPGPPCVGKFGSSSRGAGPQDLAISCLLAIVRGGRVLARPKHRSWSLNLMSRDPGAIPSPQARRARDRGRGRFEHGRKMLEHRALNRVLGAAAAHQKSSKLSPGGPSLGARFSARRRKSGRSGKSGVFRCSGF